MVKVSINRFVSRRVEKVGKEVEVSAQRLRKKTLKHLEDIFTMAARVARGEIKHINVCRRLEQGESMSSDSSTLMDKLDSIEARLRRIEEEVMKGRKS